MHYTTITWKLEELLMKTGYGMTWLLQVDKNTNKSFKEINQKETKKKKVLLLGQTVLI